MMDRGAPMAHLQDRPPIVHASVDTPIGRAALRDLTPADIDSLVQYWHFSGDEHLASLGIDRAQLGRPEDTRQRFLGAIRTGDENQKSIAFAITLDDAFVGYTRLNRYTADINYSHWHMTKPDIRAAGLSTALYPHRIKLYFDIAPITRLIHQTRTRNIGVNRMLDKFVPVAATSYIDQPDGAAAPGEFHLRYVFRADIPRFFAIAAALGQRQQERGAE